MADKPFHVRRTCTRKSENMAEQGSHPLEAYRDLPAYVLLGDPGAGKTEAFKLEAKESGGKYITARNFATFEPGKEYQDNTLFIDGLDEMRTDGSDGRIPLDQIRKHLKGLGCPRFRLSCREADWLGASDSEALKYVSPNGEIIALHLDPLSDDDIIEILQHQPSVTDLDEFIHKAQENRLDELLRNPQTLNLLVEAVGNNKWPQSRKEIYKMACRQLVHEKNPEHRQAKREKALPIDTLLDTAGYLCAIQLLSGIAGFSLDVAQANDQHAYWQELMEKNLPLLAALKTNLFQGDGEELRIPIHRSVAEYLGARYLASRIDDGLPFGRVLALVTGVDGGVVTDLRGLAAWLSVHCFSGRRILIERDPLGVVLYGDVRNFPVTDKQFVLKALRDEAQRYLWLRSDDWSSSPFGALGTKDMESALHEILISPSREEADQVLLNCALDAIRYGEPLSALNSALEAIVRDASYLQVIRTSAVRAWIRNAANDCSELLKLAKDIRTGIVEDRDDEILGIVLYELYPQIISPEQIFDYFHTPKDRNLTGNYVMFWIHYFPKKSSKENLSLLLDRLVQIKPVIRNVFNEYQLNQMVGELLVRGLEEYGDTISDGHLYDWLGVGLDADSEPRLDKKHAQRIATWFVKRPNRYKAIIEYGASSCIDQESLWLCLNNCEMRLHSSNPPTDIEIWYLEKAVAEKQEELARYYFTQVIRLLKQRDKQQDLTLSALEFLEPWVEAHPSFQPWLSRYITCPLGEWEQKRAIKNRESMTNRQKQKNTRISYYRHHITAIRDGSAHTKILYELAMAHEGLIYEAQGETPYERLENFLDGDNELIKAAYTGFRHALDRNDLPSVSEIIDLETKGRMHYIRLPCLVGIDELFRKDPANALQLDDTVLSRLLAFQFTYHMGVDPAWFKALIRQRPALVAEILPAYALSMLRAGKEHISGLYPLAYDDAYAEIARIVLPKLLEGFPLRTRKSQLSNALAPLLQGALHYLDKELFTALIARKVELSSMDAAQRVYWLSCGLLLAPDVYETRLFQYIGKSAVRKGYLADFLYRPHGERRLPDWMSMFQTTTLARLIELLAPDCSLDERTMEEDWVSPAMHTASIVRSFINTLSNNPNEIAFHELERLLTIPSLARWYNYLRSALHTQRITRRKTFFRRLSVAEVGRTLANLQSANAADLAALTYFHLRDIAEKIRHGNTNDYRQYWSYDKDNKKLDKTRPENDCRDALLSDLKERLGKLNIDVEREGNYADDKRADIKILFCGTNGFNIPIEIKKDNHVDLWRSIHEQLITKYVRDPGTDGYGIYLVFWFGGQGMRPSPDGSKKPRDAKELEDRLRQTLSPEESHRIQVCVIDCALPQT